MKKQRRDIDSRISDYMDDGKWKELTLLLKAEIDSGVNDYWIYINLAISLYYQGFNEKALEYSAKAITIESHDPFILYHHGNILFYNQKYKDAILYWEKILNMSNDYLSYGRFGGGKRWALGLKNDVRYYIGLACFYLNDLNKAVKFSKAHLKHRKKGIPSFVTKAQVEKELFEMVSLRKSQSVLHLSGRNAN